MHIFDNFEHRVGVEEVDVRQAIRRGLSPYGEIAREQMSGHRLWGVGVDKLCQEYWGAPFKSSAPANGLGMSLQALVLRPNEGTGIRNSAIHGRGIYPESANVFPADPGRSSFNDLRPTKQVVLGLASFLKGQREPVMHAIHLHQTGVFAGIVVLEKVHGLDEVSYHRAMAGESGVQPYAGYTIESGGLDQRRSETDATPLALYNSTECVQVLGLLSLHGDGGMYHRELFESLVNAQPDQEPQRLMA